MYKSYYIIILATLLLGCTRTEEIVVDPYRGGDNFIYEFSLQTAEASYRAVVTDGSISLTVPPEFSLEGATAAYELSELATIAPDPGSITDWEAPIEFQVTSYNGTRRTYAYTLHRQLNSYEGDLVLRTQAEVDAFADSGITAITGSLILGKKSNESINDLSGLRNLVEVGESIVFMNCSDLESIEFPSLEKVGNMYFDKISYQYPDMTRVQYADLPKLRTVTYSLDLPARNDYLPSLEYVGGDLRTKVTEGSLQKLKRCNGKLRLSSTVHVECPELEFAGDMILPAGSIDFPKLTEVGNLDLGTGVYSFPVLEKCTSITTLNRSDLDIPDGFPALKQIAGSINAGGSVCPLLEQVSCDVSNGTFPTLEQVGGSVRDADCPLLTSIPGDVQNSTLPLVTSIGGTVKCERYAELEKNYPSLHEVGGIVIDDQSHELAEEKWDFSGYEIGTSGLRINKNAILPRIIGPETLVGELYFYLYLHNAQPLELEGFRTVGALFIASLGNDGSRNSPIELPSIETVEGDCYLHGRRVEMANLKRVGGHLNIEADNISMPALERIGKRFTTDYCININRYGDEPFAISFPKLTEVGDNTLSNSQICFYISDYTVPTLEFPELQSVHGRVVIGGEGNSHPDHTLLETVSMPKLHTVEGDLKIGASYSFFKGSIVNKLSFPALTSVASVNISKHPLLFDFSTFAPIVPSLKNGLWTVTECGYNPTLQNMLDGEYIGE